MEPQERARTRRGRSVTAREDLPDLEPPKHTGATRRFSELRIFRDYQATYLPLLGERLIRCETLWYDGVRAAGAVLAFTARHPDEAGFLASLNPWRRAGEGTVFRAPGVFAVGPPPPGPGTQRSGHFVCGQPESIPEPGTGTG